MNHTDAIDKVVRLLRLAKSDNPHEAALAAAKAQEIIDRHKLSASDLGEGTGASLADEPIADFKAAPLEEGSSIASWKSRLAMVIAGANQCRVYLNRGHGAGIAIVGRASDAEAVRYLYAWLVREVDRLADRDGAGLGRTWRNNFRIGVVETIASRLRAQKEETRAAVKDEARAVNPNAIVRVEQAIARVEEKDRAVDVWLQKNLRLRTTRSTSRYNSSARDAGRRAGHEISFNGTRGAFGTGQRKLGSG